MKIEKIKKSHTQYIGKEIIDKQQIDSTHKWALRQIDQIKNGTIILAEQQSSAIGTKGRTWYTGKNNIAMSIVIFPQCHIQQLEGLTKNIAIVIQEAIYELYGKELSIKEPNDLLCNGKKVCGILTQTATKEQQVKYIVISIGMNVNEMQFPEEIQNIATSLKKEWNIEYAREEIIIKIIEKLEKIKELANLLDIQINSCII